MRRTDLNYLVIALLVGGSLYLLLSGLMMDTMGLHRFAFHAQVGYAWVAFAVAHLLFSWGRLLAYWRHRWRPHPPRDRPGQLPEPQQQVPEPRRRRWLVSILSGAGGFLIGRLFPARRAVELTESVTDVGQFYHQWSRIGAGKALGMLLTPGEQPESYKTYPQAKQIELPRPYGDQGLSLELAIETRRSRRDYTDAALSLSHLSHLLHLGQGLTSPERELRAVPSAGALYPLEVYAVVHHVEGLPAGIYHYAVRSHRLESLQEGDFRAAMVTAGLGQDFLGQASVCFVISAIWQRTRWKYRERTYRYVLMEAGHLGQNLYLAATSLGLGAVAVGAFFDEALDNLLELDGIEEAALYLVSVGQVATESEKFRGR